jgi:broad specificity phosphatase PhoE
MSGMPLVYLIQHAEKHAGPGDPGPTARGLAQAAQTARWLDGRDVRRLFSSPQRRARQTAEVIASTLGLTVMPDPRLRERVNWAGTGTFEAFFGDWRRSVYSVGCPSGAAVTKGNRTGQRWR